MNVCSPVQVAAPYLACDWRAWYKVDIWKVHVDRFNFWHPASIQSSAAEAPKRALQYNATAEESQNIMLCTLEAEWQRYLASNMLFTRMSLQV